MKGILYVVGIGPGAGSKMTIEAEKILWECPVIAGYTGYIKLVKAYFEQLSGTDDEENQRIREALEKKEYLETPMRGEVERCHMALKAASLGKKVAMVCSGDSGVYGMAGILLQLHEEYPWVEIEIIPGVTAAVSGAAVLGAPIGHDFAVISLSDLLTPWEVIEKRLQGAAMADFVICLYNPASHRRKDHLKRACELLCSFKPADTVCGYVKNIGRAGEEAKILSLEELTEEDVDMFTTVFIGNSETREINGRMVTPRGYLV